MHKIFENVPCFLLLLLFIITFLFENIITYTFVVSLNSDMSTVENKGFSLKKKEKKNNNRMANSLDPDETAVRAVSSGSSLFVCTGSCFCLPD